MVSESYGWERSLGNTTLNVLRLKHLYYSTTISHEPVQTVLLLLIVLPIGRGQRELLSVIDKQVKRYLY